MKWYMSTAPPRIAQLRHISRISHVGQHVIEVAGLSAPSAPPLTVVKGRYGTHWSFIYCQGLRRSQMLRLTLCDEWDVKSCFFPLNLASQRSRFKVRLCHKKMDHRLVAIASTYVNPFSTFFCALKECYISNRTSILFPRHIVVMLRRSLRIELLNC